MLEGMALQYNILVLLDSISQADYNVIRGFRLVCRNSLSSSQSPPVLRESLFNFPTFNNKEQRADNS